MRIFLIENNFQLTVCGWGGCCLSFPHAFAQQQQQQTQMQIRMIIGKRIAISTNAPNALAASFLNGSKVLATSWKMGLLLLTNLHP